MPIDAFSKLTFEAEFQELSPGGAISYVEVPNLQNNIPAVLELMRRTIAAAHRHGIPVGVCGESAADPIVGVLWAAMGADVLSMSGTYIPVMAKLFRRLSRSDLDDYAKLANEYDPGAPAQAIFDACRAWMLKKIPDLDDLLI